MGVVILKPRRDQRTHPRERFPHNDIGQTQSPTGHRPARHRTHPRRGTTPGRRAARSAGGATPPVGRQLYCSTACRKTAFRRRHQQPGPTVTVPAARPRPRDHRLRMAPDCGDRYLGEQRCESCGTFARRVGIGGACPNCDWPVADFRPARPGGGHHRQEITSAPVGHRKSQARLAFCTVPVGGPHRALPGGDPQTPAGGPDWRFRYTPAQFRVTP
jgi:hypothetical protein